MTTPITSPSAVEQRAAGLPRLAASIWNIVVHMCPAGPVSRGNNASRRPAGQFIAAGQSPARAPTPLLMQKLLKLNGVSYSAFSSAMSVFGSVPTRTHLAPVRTDRHRGKLDLDLVTLNDVVIGDVQPSANLKAPDQARTTRAIAGKLIKEVLKQGTLGATYAVVRPATIVVMLTTAGLISSCVANVAGAVARINPRR
jgi:hypothetical protein